MALIQKISDVTEWFADNNTLTAGWRFVPESHSTMQENTQTQNDYPLMVVEQPVSAVYQDKFTDVTFTTAFHNIMPSTSHSTEINTELDNIWEIATQYVAFFKNFQSLNEQYIIDPDPLFDVDLIGEANLLSELYSTEDVNISVYVELSLRFMNVFASKCDISL